MNTDDRALADLIARLRTCAEQSEMGKNFAGTPQACRAAADRLEAFHAKPVAETFVARIGNRPMAQIDSVDELLRLINGGAKFAEIYRGERVDNVDGDAALQSPPPVVSGEAREWECFKDAAYHDMWCVRRIGSRKFGDGFHVASEAEAHQLCAALSPVEPVEHPDCPHAAPFRYCAECPVTPCPIGLGEKA